MNVVDKTAGDTYLAEEFTQFKNEVQNLIVGSGLVLSAGSQVQARESVMRNAISGQGCVASGTANAIILTTRSPFSAGAPSILQDDATYSARITTTNTGAVTVNVNGIGVVPVKKNNYADELDAGDITAGLYDFVYSTSAAAFELVAKNASFADATETVKGLLKLATTALAQAGINDTDAITALKLHETIIGGVVQSWEDLTLSRAPSVVYTNTTGRPICVAVVAEAGVAQNSSIFLEVDGLTVVIERFQAIGTGQFFASAPVIVQDGSTYVVSVLSGGAIYKNWYELR